jgi:hypothetical protein
VCVCVCVCVCVRVCSEFLFFSVYDYLNTAQVYSVLYWYTRTNPDAGIFSRASGVNWCFMHSLLTFVTKMVKWKICQKTSGNLKENTRHHGFTDFTCNNSQPASVRQEGSAL